MARSRQSFDLKPGDRLNWRYEVLERIGEGTEGEVYKIKEKATGLTRAAKVYYDAKNSKKRFVRYARKLDALRDCDIVVKYFHAEEIFIGDSFVYCLISEYFDGAVLDEFLNAYRARRMPPFEALHLIYNLASCIEDMDAREEFRGSRPPDTLFV